MIKLSNNWSIYLLAFLFFAFGFAAASFLKNSTKQTHAESVNSTPKTSVLADNSTNSGWVEVSPSPVALALPTISNVSSAPSQPSGKFIIQEVQKITANKTTAETGEQVDFNVTLKNVGDKKKFLTHICFQYSGGNFGCLLNKNLFPGEEFNINNSMIFPNPGNYSVWVVWSQDKTNFYRPVKGSTSTVTVN